MRKQLRADLDALLETAAGVAGTGTELGQALAHVEMCQYKGHEFGWYAERAGIDEAHDKFAAMMVAALTTGQSTFAAIADNMVLVAKEYGLTDASVADDFHTLPTPHE